MKILQLCKKFPFPLKDGESIAVTSLARSMRDLGCELTLLAMNTSKHFFKVEQLPSDFDHYKQIFAVEVDNRIKPFDAFFNLFSDDSYNISRFVSNAFRNKLIQLLKAEQYDVIQLETLYLAPYIPTIRQYSKAKIAMRSHNVEHEIWQRMTSNERFFPKKWYLNHLTNKLEKYEIKQLKAYDVLIPITQRDLNKFRDFGYKNKAVITPIGLNCEDYKPDYSSYKKNISISFIGSLDWMPNIEGLKWFLDNTWDDLQAQFPKIQLHIAGRNTPNWLANLNKKNIKIHGEVACASTFINQHSLMIVPLLSGSGMRAKILEGMALGKIVLTTRLGLEGIHAKHKEEVLVADTPEEFINCVRYCYKKKKRLEAFGRKAQEFVVKNYDSHEIARQLVDAYEAVPAEAL